jgi:hypothetical protein
VAQSGESSGQKVERLTSEAPKFDRAEQGYDVLPRGLMSIFGKDPPSIYCNTVVVHAFIVLSLATETQ